MARNSFFIRRISCSSPWRSIWILLWLYWSICGPDLYIERIAGGSLRVSWRVRRGAVRNAELLHLLEKRMEERDSWQGKALAEFLD